MSDVNRLFLVAVGLCCAFYLIVSGDRAAEDEARKAIEAKNQAEWSKWDNLTPAQKAYRMHPIIKYVLEEKQ